MVYPDQFRLGTVDHVEVEWHGQGNPKGTPALEGDSWTWDHD